MSELSKIVNLALIASLSASQFGCTQRPVLTTTEKPIECTPLSENDQFTAGIYIHESAKDRIQDVDALCELVEVTGKLMGAQGPNEILFLTKDISEDQFVSSVMKFMGLSKKIAKYKYDEFRAGYILGFQNKIANKNNIVVIIDDSNAERNLMFVMAIELRHSVPDGLPQEECELGDSDDWSPALGFMLGAYDRALNHRNGIGMPTQFTCGGRKQVEVQADQDAYDKAYDYSQPDGTTIFDLVRKSLYGYK